MRINNDYLDFSRIIDEDYNVDANTDIVDLKSLPEMYDESPESIAKLNKWLRNHKDDSPLIRELVPDVRIMHQDCCRHRQNAAIPISRPADMST